MKSYESTLAFLHSRRICRLLSSFLQSTVCSKRTSLFLSLLSILSIFSSVTAAAQQQQRNPSLSSSVTYNNGSSAILNPARRRILTTTPISQLSTTTLPSLLSITTPLNNELHYLINKTDKFPQKESRSTLHLVIVLIVCPFLIIVTIVGNIFVILAVCLVRKLRTASNILIVSLAVSDILVGLFIMPLAMVNEMFGKWILGSVMCDIWTSTDVLLCTSSILNFLVISIDRYCIINHPFKYAPMRKVKLLSLMIAGVWILSALVSLPPILGWGRQAAREGLYICEVNPKLDYQIFATMLSFYIPLIFVLIIYANIYRTAQTAMDNRSSVQMSQFLNHNNSSANIGQINANTPLAQHQINGNSCSQPHLLLTVSNVNEDGSSNSVNEQQNGGGRRTPKRSTNESTRASSLSFLSPSRCLGRRISAPFNGRLSVFATRRVSFFRHVHLPNQKAIRTLGVILGTFIVCWLPFMLYAIIKPLDKSIGELRKSGPKLNAPGWVDSVLLWFGYFSSTLNPIIYSKFNREFRLPFREIMYCRCRGLNEKIRRQDYLENLYGDNHLQPPPPLAHPHNHQTQQSGTNIRGSGGLQATI